MKKITPFLLLLFALVSYEMSGQAICDAVTIDVTTNVLNNEIDEQHAETILTATNTIEIGGEATYKAGTSITLNPGFKVELGGKFSASIEDCNATNAFATKWETTSANETIAIPTFLGEVYNYTVDWGDMSTSTYTSNGTTSADAAHTYSIADEYTVTITGIFPRIYFNNSGDKDKIIEIVNWGDIAWTSMENAFYGCSNLDVIDTDAPNLTGVTSLSSMFRDCGSLDQDIGNWDVRNITHMENMLDYSGLSITSYEETLNGWADLDILTPSLQHNVTLGAEGLYYLYCSTLSFYGRTILTNPNDLNWDIIGDGNACSRGNNTEPVIIDETKDDQSFSIYPNPAKDKIHISGIDVKQNTISIQILDVSGRVVLKKENQTEIDISILKAGVYFVKVLGETQRTVKLIKQ